MKKGNPGESRHSSSRLKPNNMNGNFLLPLLLLALFNSQCCGSLVEDSNSIRDFIFYQHPMQHRFERSGRRASLGEERMLTNVPTFKSPSYQHKVSRLSRFVSSPSAFAQNGILPMRSPLLYIDSGQDNEKSNNDYIYVPIIGPKALSNLGEFFDHLRRNVEILSPGMEDSFEEREPDILNPLAPEGRRGVKKFMPKFGGFSQQ